MKTFKKSAILTAVAILSIFLISCRSDSNDDGNSSNSYPKQVTITYKVTGINTSTAAIVTYKNETGGLTNLENVTLPYSKTITRTVNKYDDASLGYGTNTNTNVKLEILVNNTVQKSQEYTSTSGAIVYLFQ